MRILGRLAALLLALSLVAGCTLPRGAALSSEVLKEQDSETPTFSVVPVSRANVDLIDGWPSTGWSGGYHWLSGATRGPSSPLIRAGDLVDLTIWDNQDNSLLIPNGQKTVEMKGLVVSSGGTIFVPYVDEVVIRNMTPADARRKIQEALAPIAPSAQVQLALQAGQSNSVDLVSGVGRPGSYPLSDRNGTILSLIAQGGGIDAKLRNPLVRVIRDGKTYEVRADRLFSEARLNVVLRGNDQVVIEEDDRYFTALGATGSEKLVYFDKEKITTLEALSMIGGLSDSRANPKGVLILREYSPRALRTDGKGPALPQVVFTFDLTSADGLFAARKFRVNPGDTVLATESPVTAARTVFGLIGSAFGLVNTANAAVN